jgi:hypothetical protein
MFKKAAIFVTLIALSVPLIVKEGFIELDYDDAQVVIAHVEDDPSGETNDCSGYPEPEEKAELFDDEVQLSYVSDSEHCGPPCGGDPKPFVEYPEDNAYGAGKVVHPVDIVICRIPCGGDPITVS